MKRFVAAAFLFAALLPAQEGVLVSRYYPGADFALTADPEAPAWKGVRGVIADKSYHSEPLP